MLSRHDCRRLVGLNDRELPDTELDRIIDSFRALADSTISTFAAGSSVYFLPRSLEDSALKKLPDDAREVGDP